MIKKILFLLTSVCAFAACSNDIPNNKEEDKGYKEEMAIFAYMVGTNNLDESLMSNIRDMYVGLSKAEKPVSLLVYWDGITSVGENASNHVLLKYWTDGKGKVNGMQIQDSIEYTVKDVLDASEIVKEYSPQICTEKEVMKSVLKDMLDNVETQKIGFIYASHGSSWLEGLSTSRAIGQDGITANTMLVTDLAEVLGTVGHPFEFLLFDACFMGTIEVNYILRNVANYQISSAMEVGYWGFPYALIMGDLCEGNVDAYKRACKTYIDYYNYSLGVVALTDSKEIEPLVNVLRQEIVEHKAELADFDGGHLQEYGNNTHGRYLSVDMGHFVRELNGGVLPEAFASQLENTIIYKDFVRKVFSSQYLVNPTKFYGLGMYIPVSARYNWNQYFKTLDWYTASGWNEVDFSWDF